MKRRIYLHMKSLEEARELWLARFDLQDPGGHRGGSHGCGPGPGDRGSGDRPEVIARGPPGGHGRFCGDGRGHLRGHPG